jgi:hypothetical protein
MSRLHLFSAIASLVLLTGCPQGTPDTPQAAAKTTDDAGDSKADAPKADAPAVAVAEAVHDVSCGCALPDVKTCGEWVKVDGSFVPLSNHGLKGAMPFCGKKGLKAKVAGELKDGKLVASKVEVLQ